MSKKTNAVAAAVVANLVSNAQADAEKTAFEKLEESDPRMADAIAGMASKLVSAIVADAGLAGLEGLEGWKALKGCKEEIKALTGRMYDNGSFGQLRLRGLELKAAKEALWAAFNSDINVSPIVDAHNAHEAKAKAAFDRRNAARHPNKRGGKLSYSEGGLDDWRAYQASKRKNNGLGV